MNSGEVDGRGDGSGLVVSDGQEVSLQVFQQVYHSLTGRMEHLSRLLYDHHNINLGSLQNLHAVVEQTMEQFDVVASNCSVTVRYSNSRSERFSSFERFELQCTQKNVPCEDLTVEYEFAVRLPKSREATKYKLTIGMRSTLGVLERFAKTKATDAERSMFYNYDNATARIEIEYVDLALARNLEGQVEDWYRGLPKRNLGIVATASKKISSILSVLVRVFAILASAYAVGYLLSDMATDLEKLFRIVVVAVATISAVGIISLRTAALVEKWLNRISPVSVVSLSSADTAALGNHDRSTKVILFKSFATIVGTVCLGLITTFIAVKIGIS